MIDFEQKDKDYLSKTLRRVIEDDQCISTLIAKLDYSLSMHQYDDASTAIQQLLTSVAQLEVDLTVLDCGIDILR